MTREQINKYIRIVPCHAKQAYGIEELSDLSAMEYKNVMSDGQAYRYFPEIPGVLVGEKLVKWETGKDDLQEVNVYDRSHMKEIVKRGHILQDDDIVGIFLMENGRMRLDIARMDNVNKRYSGCVAVDNTFIYYDPKDIDLDNNGPLKMTGKAVFLVRRYGDEYMIPYKGMMPGDWGSYE